MAEQRDPSGASERRALHRKRARQNSMIVRHPDLAQDFMDFERARRYEAQANMWGPEWAAANLPQTPAYDLLDAQHKAGKMLLELAKTEATLAKNMQAQNPGEVFKSVLNFYDSVHGSRASATGGVAQQKVRADSVMAGKAFDQLIALDQAENEGLGGALAEVLDLNVLIQGLPDEIGPENAAVAQAYSQKFHEVISTAPDADQAALRLTKLSTLSGLDPATLQGLATVGAIDDTRAQIQGMGGEITNRAAGRIAQRSQYETQAATHIQSMQEHYAATRNPEAANMIEALFGPLITGRGMDTLTQEDLDGMIQMLGLGGGMDAVPDSPTGAQVRTLAESMVKMPPSVALELSTVIAQNIIESDGWKEWAEERGYDWKGNPGGVFRRGREERKARRGSRDEYDQAVWAYNVNNGIIPATLGQRLSARWIQGRELLDGLAGQIFSDNTYARVVADKEGKPLGQVEAETRRQIQHAREQGALQSGNPAAIAEVAEQPAAPSAFGMDLPTGPNGEPLSQGEFMEVLPGFARSLPREVRAELRSQGITNPQQAYEWYMGQFAEQPAAEAAVGAEGEVLSEAAAPAEAPAPAPAGMDALRETARRVKGGSPSTTMAGGVNLNPLLLVEAMKKEHPEASQEEIVAALEGSDAQTGSDGWATYTLHPDGRITFVNPDTEQEQTVTEQQSGSYWAIRQKAFGEELSPQQQAAVSQAEARQAQKRQPRQASGAEGPSAYWGATPEEKAALNREGGLGEDLADWAGAPFMPGVTQEQAGRAGAEVQAEERAGEASAALRAGKFGAEPTEFDKIMALNAALEAGDPPPFESDEARAIRMGVHGSRHYWNRDYSERQGRFSGGNPVPGSHAYLSGPHEKNLRALEEVAERIREGTKGAGGTEAFLAEVMSLGLAPGSRASSFEGTTGMEEMAKALKAFGTTNPELYPQLETALRIYEPETAEKYFGPTAEGAEASRRDALMYATPGGEQIGAEALAEGFDADTAGVAPTEAPAEAPAKRVVDPLAGEDLSADDPSMDPRAEEIPIRLRGEGVGDTRVSDPFEGLTSGEGAEVPQTSKQPSEMTERLLRGEGVNRAAEQRAVPPEHPISEPAKGVSPVEETEGEAEPLETSEQPQYHRPPAIDTSLQPKEPPKKDAPHPGAPRQKSGVDYGGRPPGEQAAGEPPDSFSGLTPGMQSAPGVTAFEAQSHGITPASTSAAAAFPPGMGMAQGATGSASSPRARYNEALKRSDVMRLAQEAAGRVG